MGGSTADTPTTPEFLRASDAERDDAVSELRNEFAEGRLSHDTFMHRMQSALDARHRGQLDGLFTDLPPRRPGLIARIKAVLRGEPPDQQAGPPGTRRIHEAPALPGFPWGSSAPAAPRPAGRLPASPLSASPPSASITPPAPLFFPPGSGMRFTIGRTRECDLCLTDLSVSRMHALLVRREDGWVLSDLGSHNGTRLNGWLVREPVPVRPGDRVEFGSMAFVVQGDPPPGDGLAEPAEPAAPPGSSGPAAAG
jgi:FHA domain/DUF1707 SHOCT-like domain